jgi:hypothetical protein
MLSRWWRRVRRSCGHDNVRCIHGDEIIAVGYKRGHCLDCGKWFVALPVLCSVTGKPHPGMAWDDGRDEGVSD